jgi:hypothetical protein
VVALIGGSACTHAADRTAPAGAERARATKGYGVDDPALVAGVDYVAGQVVIGLLPSAGSDAPGAIADRVGARVAGAVGRDVVLLEFGDEARARQALPVLLSHPDVRFVERNGFAGIPPTPGGSGPRR